MEDIEDAVEEDFEVEEEAKLHVIIVDNHDILLETSNNLLMITVTIVRLRNVIEECI